MSFLTGKTSTNTFDMNAAALPSSYQGSLYQVFTKNEVDPARALLLANAEMRNPGGALAAPKYAANGKLINLSSGFTFGVIQFDLANGPQIGKEAFSNILINVNDQSGKTLFTQHELDVITLIHYKDSNTSAEAIAYRQEMVRLSGRIDQALQSAYGEQRVQEITAKHLADLEVRAQSWVDKAISRVGNPDIATAISSSDFAKLLAGDLANNMGAAGGKRAFNQFLDGYLKFSQTYSDQGLRDWIANHHGRYELRRVNNILKISQGLPGECVPTDPLADALPLKLDATISIIDQIDQKETGQSIEQYISDVISNVFTAAQRFIPRRDPLTLDLNGNGIETVAPNLANPILFDHEGNGIKTGTGWIAPSDGFLVLDRNGNGTIDDGTELFGDNTPIYGNTVDANGQPVQGIVGKAADGFDALAQQDSNADGVVNAQDANFADLRVWQDLNQDGISQANELKTLAELGIAGINIGKTENSQILPGGNEIADLGTFTRTDGTTGAAGVSSRMADVNLASDTFHRSFIDVIPTTTDTATLPDMQGSGVVRDLREAASLTTAEGAILASALSQFAAATTRNAQRAQLDTLLTDWAATAGFPDMAARAMEHGYTLVTGFYKMPWDTLNAQNGVTGMSVGTDANGQSVIRINMSAPQLALLDQAYSALKESVYLQAANDAVFEVRRVG